MLIKRFLGKVARYVLLPLLALLLLAAAVLTGYFAWQRHLTAREIAITAPDGIQSLEAVTLGGTEQWISIRGRDRANPVLLFLHGGPGAPEMVPVRHYNGALEEHFVVVNWDQRGAGKSYAAGLDPDTLTMEQILADTLELTALLRERFRGQKIYLAGHSWGTIPGVHAARLHPEHYHAYIGIGQAVNFVEAEKISYRFTLQKAEELGHTQALQELREIGPPPYTGEDFQRRIGIQRKWLFAFGGEVYGETDNTRYQLRLLALHLAAPEYSFADMINFVRGNLRSGRLMWDDLLAVNLPEQAPALDLPVYFLAGRHDYVTVFEKVEEYNTALEAPHKEIIWFEQSAHSPNFERPDDFAAVLVRIKAETLP